MRVGATSCPMRRRCALRACLCRSPRVRIGMGNRREAARGRPTLQHRTGRTFAPDDQESRPGRSDALGAPTVLLRLCGFGQPLDPPGPDIRVWRLSGADHVAVAQSTPRVSLSNRPSIASHSVLAGAKMRRPARSADPPQRLCPGLLAIEPRDGDPRNVETVPRVVSHHRRVAPQELDALVTIHTTA